MHYAQLLRRHQNHIFWAESAILAFNFSVGLSSQGRLSPLFNTLRSEKPFQNPPRQTEAHCPSSTNREHQTEQPWGTVVVNFYANASFKQRLSSSVFSTLNTKIRRTSTATLWVGLRLHSRMKYIYSRFSRLKSFTRYRGHKRPDFLYLFRAHFCRLLHERNPLFFLMLPSNHSSSGSLLSGAMTRL